MKIFCIGRNYLEHIRELSNAITSDPVVFMKAENAILNGMVFTLPRFSNDIHYEVEIVLKIAKSGKYILPENAASYYDEIGLGIDFTARTLQKKLQSQGLPWELSKSFDGSAVLSPFSPKENFDLRTLKFGLHKNKNIVQEGNTVNMIFSFDFLITFLSEYFTLQKGDLIFTGTPKGIGKISSDDILEGFLENEKVLHCVIK